VQDVIGGPRTEELGKGSDSFAEQKPARYGPSADRAASTCKAVLIGALGRFSLNGVSFQNDPGRSALVPSCQVFAPSRAEHAVSTIQCGGIDRAASCM